jgi:hypothetical protein
MSWSRDLKTWTYAGHRHAGENVTVLRHAGQYVMFHSPRNGIGVKRSRNLAVWGDDEQLLLLGQNDWPWAQGRLTAATVIDLTGQPRVGKYVMFFHGSSREGLKRQPAHGAASLALAWSDDLETWHWPGKGRSTDRALTVIDSRERDRIVPTGLVPRCCTQVSGDPIRLARMVNEIKRLAATTKQTQTPSGSAGW